LAALPLPEHGWTFRVPGDVQFSTRLTQLDFYDPADDTLQDMRLKGGFLFYKLPHKDGEKANVGSPLAKHSSSMRKMGRSRALETKRRMRWT